MVYHKKHNTLDEHVAFLVPSTLGARMGALIDTTNATVVDAKVVFFVFVATLLE